MENKNILVKEHPDYQVNVEDLKLCIEESYYSSKSLSFFEKSLNFYLEVENKKVSELSEKQLNWLWEVNCILHDRKNNRAAVQEKELEYLKIAAANLSVPKKESLLSKIIKFFSKS